jgi:hypothetical protein
MTYGDNNNTARDTAAKRLRHLHEYYLKHPVTGPTPRRPPTIEASAPLNLATLSHIQTSVREVTELTRAANPDAGPAPSRPEAVYDWCRQQTEHADETTQQRLEAIEYRHYLEHAIRAGDKKVIRKHRCPECRTWGLMWDATSQRALCTNTECVDSDGCSTTVTLARLAYEHVTARKNLRQARTT